MNYNQTCIYNLGIYEYPERWDMELTIDGHPYTIRVPKDDNHDMLKIIEAYRKIQQGYYYINTERSKQNERKSNTD